MALVILFFGLLAASFFSRAALLAAVNVNFRSSRLLSISIRIIISIFALSMVFEVLGVAKETMLSAFGTAFGAVMLSLAIAFGIGGKDVAREFLEKRLITGKKEEKEDDDRLCRRPTPVTSHSASSNGAHLNRSRWTEGSETCSFATLLLTVRT